MSLLERAKKRYQQCKSDYSDQHKRILEDLKFSNPADPQQWEEGARTTRQDAKRPCLTFDHTNQYIHQVVNDARQNKPGIQVMPVGSGSDKDVADAVSGLIRHVEYQSRAGIAYDTAIESAARCGLGWMRVAPIVVDKKLNYQELRIIRVHDVLSVMLGPHSEPDGSDAPYGFVETRLPRSEFKRKYPGKSFKPLADDDQNWFGEDVRIVEYYEFQDDDEDVDDNDEPVETAKSDDKADDESDDKSDKGESDEDGVIAEQTERKVRWVKLTGADILKETTFPGSMIPIVPVLGDEIWIEGKRFLSGMVRRMMDSARSYNYMRSAEIEAMALQPKAPYLAAADAIEGHEPEWKNANSSNDSYLPWNHLDDAGNPVPQPSRQMPPVFPAAFAQASLQAQNDMQAAVGMYKSNLGAPSSATSGKAKRQDQIEGDTANFHYMDNLSRSVEQLGRIVVGAIPIVYDEKRQARILQENGQSDEVTIDPKIKVAKQRDRNGKLTINPTVGTYSVRVKTGPSYTTLRQQTAEALSDMLTQSPQMLPILGPFWARQQDFPESEKLSKILLAMAPPQVQALEDGNTDIPPEAQAKIAGLEQQVQQMQQQLQQAGHVIETKQVEQQGRLAEVGAKAQADQPSLQTDNFRAQTERMKAQADADAQKRKDDREDMLVRLKMRELDIKETEMAIKARASQPEQANPLTEHLTAVQQAADIDATRATTDQTLIENHLLLTQPPPEKVSETVSA